MTIYLDKQVTFESLQTSAELSLCHTQVPASPAAPALHYFGALKSFTEDGGAHMSKPTTLCELERRVCHLLMEKNAVKVTPLIGFTFFPACPLQTPGPGGDTAFLLLTGNSSARLENVKLMQMERQ